MNMISNEWIDLHLPHLGPFAKGPASAHQGLSQSS